MLGLGAALDGFTIAQVTDLHVGMTIDRDYVARVVARTNAIGADAIALTGDLVDGTVAALRDDVAPLAALRAPHGRVLRDRQPRVLRGRRAVAHRSWPAWASRRCATSTS
jgi:3',5'-cyclic AMP phosphodiesterase CpdA